MKDDTTYNLLVRFFAEEATPEERRTLDTWRKASRENQAVFHEMQRLWQMSSPEDPAVVPDREISLLELKESFKQSPVPKRPSVFALPRWRQGLPTARPAVGSYLAIAACFMLLIGVTLFYNLREDERHVTTANAQQAEVTLPDGSTVRLNHSSDLSYEADFGNNNRRVNLAGEAFFQVVSDSLPFVVITEGAAVRVHGTKFNVWSRTGETRVVVSEGLVSLAADEHEIFLRKNQKSKTQPGETPNPPVIVDAGKYLAWLKGELYFDMETLAEVARELSRKYDVAIKISSPEITARTVTGSFGQQPIAVTLKSLCLALDLSYHKEGREFVISRP